MCRRQVHQGAVEGATIPQDETSRYLSVRGLKERLTKLVMLFRRVDDSGRKVVYLIRGSYSRNRIKSRLCVCLAALCRLSVFIGVVTRCRFLTAGDDARHPPTSFCHIGSGSCQLWPQRNKAIFKVSVTAIGKFDWKYILIQDKWKTREVQCTVAQCSQLVAEPGQDPVYLARWSCPTRQD